MEHLEQGQVLEAKPPPMDAISAQLYKHRKRGEKFFKHAEGALHLKIKAAQFLKLDIAAFYFYLSSVSYRCCSRWRDAGESLIRCAEVHVKAKMAMEAAVLFSEASEVLMKVDRDEGKRCTKKAVAIYCDMGRFDVAGRLERRMASAEFLMGHWEESAAHYRKSANFLAGEMLLDQSDACIEKAAECYINMHELNKASQMYVMMAEGCRDSNLRRFNARSKLFMSILCKIGVPLEMEEIELPPAVDWRGDPRERDKEEHEEEMKKATLAEWHRVSKEKYDHIIHLIKEYEEIDYMWASAKDRIFIRNIVKARLEYDKHMLADHLYFWNMVRPLDRIQIRLIRVLVDEIQHELDRRTEEYRLDALKKEKQKIKREKQEKQKKIMKEMGIKGFTNVDDDEVEQEALKRQALEDAIKAHEEVGVEIHGLEENDDAELMEEHGEEEVDEDEDQPKVEVKERRTRKKKARDRK